MATVGVDIGGTTWLVGRVGDGGAEMICRGLTDDEPVRTLEHVRRALPDMNVDSLGCAFPGEVDGAGTVVAWPNRPTWVGFGLADALAELFGARRMRIIDDGQAAALGESVWGVAKDVPDHLTLTFGTGIGGALVLDGRPRRPAGVEGRTIGHWRVLARDRVCPCGWRGCLQLVLATIPATGTGVSGASWPDGARLVEVVSDVMASFGVATVVVTGGRLNSPALQSFFVGLFTRSGVDCQVAGRPSESALLGAVAVAGQLSLR